MDTLFLDDCLQNLFYAEEAMKSWIPLTEYEILFESGINKEVKDKILQNEETERKSVGFIQKAINAVIEVIGNIINSITNFISSLTTKGSKHDDLDKVKQAMETDPKLKNKKISVVNPKATAADYDKYAKKLDAAIRAVEADPSHSIDNITDEITNFIKGTATGATVILATDSAIKMAESNVEIAKKIQQALREEESLMKLLSDHLGKRDAKKFKKKIDAAAKNTKLHQLKVKLFHHQYDSLQECVESTLNAFKHFNLDTLRMGKQLLKNEYTGKVIKTVAKGEVELAKHNIKKKIDKVVPTTKKPKIKPRTGVNAPLGEFIFGTNKK